MNKAKPVILILFILLGIAISPDKVLAKSNASTNTNLLLLPSMSFSVDTANYKIGFSIEDTLHLKSVEVVEILTEKVKVIEINRKVKVSRFGFVRLLDFVGVGGDPVMDSDIPVIDIRKEFIVFRDTEPETKISFKEIFNEGLKEECVDSDEAGYLNAVVINANDQKDAWIQVFLWLSRNVPEWTYCQGKTADGDICLSKASGYLDGRLFDIQCIVLPGNKHTKFYFDITSAFMDKTQPVAGGDATR